MSEHPGQRLRGRWREGTVCLSGPIRRLALGVGDGDGAVHLGSVPVVLPGRWPPLPAHRADARRGRPVPGGQGASRWLPPGGQPGLSAAVLARTRGSHIKVAVAWRRTRGRGRLRRRHQPQPGDAGLVGRRPGAGGLLRGTGRGPVAILRGWPVRAGAVRRA